MRGPASTGGAGAGSWVLLPTLVVRSAGFPWDLLDTLVWPRTACAVEEVCAAREALRELAARALPTGRLSRGQTARLRNLRPLGPDAPLAAEWLAAWNGLAERLAATEEELAAAREADTAGAAGALRTLTADPRFRDAVVCSHPGVHRDLCAADGREPGTRLRRQIAAYAQRFAAKCETMSFFGPVNYALLDRAQPLTEPEWEGGGTCPQRRAFPAAWIWDALRARYLADPERAARLVPRRKTLRRAESALRGEPAALRVHEAADGRRTLGEIGRAAGLSPSEAARALAVALERGVLGCDALPADTDPDPVRALLARSPRDPGLRAVAELLDRFPAAAPGDKAALLAELPALAGAERGPAADRGKFYNDRSPVHEAAVGSLRLTVGGALAEDLRTRVPAALDALALAARRTRQAANRALARSLGSGTFPLTRVVREHSAFPVTPDPWFTEVVAAAVAESPGAADIDLAPALAAAPRLPVGSPADCLPVLCSVDVMVAASSLADYRPGSTPLVVGDVHDAPLLTPWALQFHPRGAELVAERDRALAAVLGPVQALSVVARRSTGLPPLRFPGRLLELGAVRGPGERVCLDELFVVSDGRRARLRARGVPGELHFHNGELDSPLHTALALPRLRPPVLPDVPYLPRLRHGSVVLARRRWRLDADVLGEALGAADPVERVTRLRERTRSAGMPRAFFAKAPHERKPVYVDTAAPLLVDGLARLARGAERVYATEVLPGPDALWLRAGQRRHAAELRCVYLERGARR
ncbi:lantibiotic dehydratase [Streptomyces sp. NPDC021224]|uniref:lantibiotic dehydratase n=1 Tax=unclassified Streptomyces TaxID=2593676 RepID=UPI0037B0ED28